MRATRNSPAVKAARVRRTVTDGSKFRRIVRGRSRFSVFLILILNFEFPIPDFACYAVCRSKLRLSTSSMELDPHLNIITCR